MWPSDVSRHMIAIVPSDQWSLIHTGLFDTCAVGLHYYVIHHTSTPSIVINVHISFSHSTLECAVTLSCNLFQVSRMLIAFIAKDLLNGIQWDLLGIVNQYWHRQTHFSIMISCFNKSCPKTALVAGSENEDVPSVTKMSHR